MTDRHVFTAHVNRLGVVTLDGAPLGSVYRVPNCAWTQWAAQREDGSGVTVLADNCDRKSTAIGVLVADRLAVGETYQITGVPSAMGGPWTIAAPR